MTLVCAAAVVLQLCVTGRDQLVDDRHRTAQLTRCDGVLDQIPHHHQADTRFHLAHLQQHPHRRGELAGVAGHPRIPAQLLVLGFAFGLGQQLRGHHQVEQLQSVVGRPRRQRQHCRDQHRQAVLARHSPQQGRLARNAVRRQPEQPVAARRSTRPATRRPPRPGPPPVQRGDHALRRRAKQALPQRSSSLTRCLPAVGHVQQSQQRTRGLRCQRRCQLLPQPLISGFTTPTRFRGTSVPNVATCSRCPPLRPRGTQKTVSPRSRKISRAAATCSGVGAGTPCNG